MNMNPQSNQTAGRMARVTSAGAMARAYREQVSLVFTPESPLPPELGLRPPYSELKAIRTRNFLIIPMIARGLKVVAYLPGPVFVVPHREKDFMGVDER